MKNKTVGIYAGKVMFEAESGKRALNAYRRVCSHTVQPHLATVHHFASEWEDDRFIALLQWVEGRTLYDWIGYSELYAEELKETPVAVVGRWITSCCEGLSSLKQDVVDEASTYVGENISGRLHDISSRYAFSGYSIPLVQ